MHRIAIIAVSLSFTAALPSFSAAQDAPALLVPSQHPPSEAGVESVSSDSREDDNQPDALDRLFRAQLPCPTVEHPLATRVNTQSTGSFMAGL